MTGWLLATLRRLRVPLAPWPASEMPAGLATASPYPTAGRLIPAPAASMQFAQRHHLCVHRKPSLALKTVAGLVTAFHRANVPPLNVPCSPSRLALLAQIARRFTLATCALAIHGAAHVRPPPMRAATWH
jgi:hypothetical protein